ncbi:MAG: NACHT domain-containing protein [Hormoscilla sp. GM7CHS1pb]|nr:NACHT domain-containing protein [Hormoscilla sp. GM7CHS1pb]
MIPKDFLKAVATERSVSKTELEVLFRALDGQSTEAIASGLKVKPEAVRKRLGEVYKKFHIPGAGPGKLAKLQKILVDLYQQNASESIVPAGARTKVLTANRVDWDSAPDVSSFYGRAPELATLEQWIVSDRCRLVALLGMGGIGKTSLAVRIAQQIQDKFEYVIWRSLRHAPPLKDLLLDLLLAQNKAVPKLEDIDELISEAIERFGTYRCLLVLDNLETILQSKELVGQYRPGYEDYGELLRRFAEAPHNSCLLLTSQEKPKKIAQLEGDVLPVRSLFLTGLKEPDAKQILQAKGLSGEVKWKILMQLYRGNPLALKIVATTIRELFNGNVAQFLKHKMLVFGDIQDLLDEPLSRLSDLEQEIIYWLAIERQPISLERLRADMMLPEVVRELLEALGSLGRRSLLETSTEADESLFTLQPTVMEYVTNQFIERVAAEICELIEHQQIAQTQLFKSHAIAEHMLVPLWHRLRTIIRNETKIKESLAELLPKLQDQSSLEIRYATVNAQNLLAIVPDIQVVSPLVSQPVSPIAQ